MRQKTKDRLAWMALVLLFAFMFWSIRGDPTPIDPGDCDPRYGYCP